MTDLYVIDTHTLLWYFSNNRRLSQPTRAVLDDVNNRFVIPAIVLAEAIFILERKGNRFTVSESELITAVQKDSRIAITPINEEVLITSTACKAVSELHDRLIVATAVWFKNRGLQTTILTRDERIQAANLVPTFW